MISVEQYCALVDELVELESKLSKLGQTVVNTSQGPYALHERALAEDHNFQQAQYNELFQLVSQKRSLVEAYDRVARYEIFLRQAG